MPDSENLLQRYTLTGDPACFRSLVEEFGGMVYAVCLRITHDPHASEDLSQDCFLELARNAARLRTSVAGWLHSAATNRALNLIRSRKRERTRARLQEQSASIRETEDFSELQPFVDEALDRLDVQLREIVISHFLRGQTQAEIAGHLSIDQATVSRRLAQGPDDVRSHLRRAGILTTVAALMNVLGQNTADAAPANLTEIVAKVGLAGVGWTATKSAGSLGLLATAAIAALGNLLLYLVCEGWVFLIVSVVEFALLAYPPTWLRELFMAWSPGLNPWSHPAFPLQRWNWTVPPPDWKQRLAAWSFMGFVWGLAAAGTLIRDHGHWGGPAAFVLLAGFGVLQAVRLGMRVWRFRSNLPTAAPDAQPVPGSATSWESVAVAAAAMLVGVAFLVAVPREPHTGLPVIHAVLLWSNIIVSAGIVLWGLRSRWTSSRSVNHVSPQNDPDESSAQHPVNKSAQYSVLAILLVASAVSVSQSLFAAATGQFVLREPYVRQIPFGVVAGGGIGVVLAVVLLFRLHLIGAQLVRWRYLLLVAAGIALLGFGAGLTGYGAYMAQAMPPPVPPAAPQPTRPLSPAELAFQEKLQQRRTKYAREMAAVVPSPLPGTCVLDSDRLSMFPMVQEGADLHAVDLAEKLELPAAVQLKHVQALLIHCFAGTLDAKPLNLVTYTFVCESRPDAEGLASAWGLRAIQKEYLVVIPFGPKREVPLTANDQLIRAIRRQVESSDLSNGPPE